MNDTDAAELSATQMLTSTPSSVRARRAPRVRPAMALRSATARWVPLLACLLILGCDSSPSRDHPGGAAPGVSAAAPAADTFTLTVVYGSEKKTWLEEQAKKFEASGARTSAGRPIRIDARAMGSGEAVQAIAVGEVKPHVFSPASGVYVPLLNERWLAASPGRTKALAPPGQALVLSPIVVAMWRPMAEVLGWPGKSIGWGDLLRVSTDPKGWGALGHPEWGAMKLGHTHPEHSNSGFLAVLAEAYAGAKKTRGLSAADLYDAKVRAFVEGVEGAMIHYGKSTGFFAEKMVERGPSYLSGAVLYENLVIESYGGPKKPELPLVAIYPVEGTFWSDHPWSVLDADWVDAEARGAAEAFGAFLLAKPQQERALALGFRPADASMAIGAPVDAAHGVDPKQPQTLLEVPDVATLRKLLDLWRGTKKAADVVIVFDKSGSMKGQPLSEAKEGAKAFVGMLDDRDEVTAIFFDGTVYPPHGPVKLGEGRSDLLRRFDGVVANGATALYDATARAYDLAQQRVKTSPNRIHAVVVMTDGKDEGSKLKLEQLRGKFSDESAPVKVFTIAYGDGADPAVLTQIAEAAKGSTAKGTPQTIVSVFRDMGAFF
ncbi:MAG: VWA domain-containing protein [Polyangiaceae bacterium]